MEVITGNLTQIDIFSHFDVIVHGANCFHVMCGGIALQIKEQFPAAYEVDCTTPKGDMEKLGTISYADIEYLLKDAYDPSVNEYKTIRIVNAYTQFLYGGAGAIHVNYDALRDCFKKVKDISMGKRIAYPMIGTGLAGGDWKIISKIIDEELAGEDHTLVVL